MERLGKEIEEIFSTGKITGSQYKILTDKIPDYKDKFTGGR
jgi:hypothetical protein